MIRSEQVVPVPLKEKLSGHSSDVWNRSFAVSKGERIKIKAPSGTGKTTLIHILYDLRQDHEGTVFYNDTPLRSMNDDQKAYWRQQQVSIVFQDLRLFPELTARENIELKRVLQKPVYEAAMISTMAERLGVAHVLDQKAGICSYGEQQRVAIIRAMMQPFDLLLMDEPFSHLDNENTRKAAAIIQEECDKRNAAFILTDLEDDDHFHYTRKLVL